MNKSDYYALLSDTINYVRRQHEAKSYVVASTFTAPLFQNLPQRAQPQDPKLKRLPSQAASIEVRKSPSEEHKSSPIERNPPERMDFPQPAKASNVPVEAQGDIKRKVEKLFPKMTIIDQVPSDERAVLLSQEWKMPLKASDIVILDFKEGSEAELFLQNVKRAIEAHFGTAEVIDASSWEQKKEWDIFFQKVQPKLILASPALLKTQQLIKYYKEKPSVSERYLGDCPLVLLSPLVHYLKEPDKKRLLWKTLCQILKPPSSSQSY